MKKNLLITIVLFFSAFRIFAASVAYADVDIAQIAPKEAYKAVFNIVSYDKDGKLLRSGYGFFITADGEGIAAYSLLKGASRADVIDFKGNKFAVHRILGANSTYDLVKFNVEGVKKPTFFDITSVGVAETGAGLNISRYTTNKKEMPQTVVVGQMEDYDEYKYYKLQIDNIDRNIGCPVYDNVGRIVAITQKNVEKNASEVCAIDVRFASTLKINAMSAINSDLKTIGIPKSIPQDEKDALTYIYMMGRNDSLATLAALNDFILHFPENAEGYTNRAAFYASAGRYDLCEQDFAEALQKAENGHSTVTVDEVHNEWSKLIYQKAVYAPEPAYKDWDLNKALEEARKAHAIRNKAFYLLQQGRCLFSLKEYGQAYDKFRELIAFGQKTTEGEWSSMATAEAWFYAARALELAGGDSLEVISLMDSTISALPKPYTPATGRYFLERAQRLELAEEYRKAVQDYNEYEKAIGPKNLSAQFYFIREQAELKAKMFQQALDDIRSAILLAPAESTYRLEEALVLLRAGLYDEAADICERLKQSYPENADCYKILGIAYGELGRKEKARAALDKAKELGDTSVEVFLERYK